MSEHDHDDGPPLIQYFRYFALGTPIDRLGRGVTRAMKKHIRKCERLRAHAARHAPAKPVPIAS